MPDLRRREFVTLLGVAAGAWPLAALAQQPIIPTVGFLSTAFAASIAPFVEGFRRGEMGVVENRPRSATARAASEVEVEIFTPAEFFDQIAGSPQTARELIHRLSQRLREADDRIVKDERRSGRPHGTHTDGDSQTALVSVENAYLAAKNPWLQRQFHAKLGLSNLPFIVGRGPVAA
jgi:hypothetical protein